MKNSYEIVKMFNIEGEKVYFSNKGEVNAQDVIITEDYSWSECAGMLYGSECECYIVLREGKELSLAEYGKFSFTYLDKTERYNEIGEEYGKTKSYKFTNDGINLSGCEVYVLYNNFNNNEIDSYDIDIFKIK